MGEKRARDEPSKLARFLRAWGADALLVLGAAAVTVGAALIWAPAGWIAGGVLLMAGGVLTARGQRGDGDG